MLGVDRQDASALLLGVADLTATVDGKALPVKFSGASIDLAREDQAWLVGKISVPSTARTVALALRWDDFGGVETLAAGKVVDARGPDLRWSAPVEWLRRNGHVVLHVDVAQSLGRRERWREEVDPGALDPLLREAQHSLKPESPMPKGQQKQTKSNKPKLSTKEKQDKKKEKKAKK